MIHLAWMGFLLALGWWIDERYANRSHPRRRLAFLTLTVVMGVTLLFNGWWLWFLLGLLFIAAGWSGIREMSGPAGLTCWIRQEHQRTMSIRAVTVWSQQVDGELLSQDGPTTRIYCARCGKDLP